MIINGSCPDADWQDIVAESPTNPLKGLLAKWRRFRDVKPQERILLLKGEQLKRLEADFGKPIENIDEFLVWLEKLKAVYTEDVKVILREGQRKYIQGQADHYKVSFAVKAREIVQSAIDKVLGNY